MARTKNRSGQIAAQDAAKPVRWRFAAYIRLSREDNVKSDDDSNSVRNQQKILMEYYRAHADEFESAEFYVDDGCTGTDSERDAFKRLLADIRAQKINCVAVKDLSRLSRNYSEAGGYIDTYFTMWDVRFICLGDPFIDSYRNPESATNIAVPITNVMNDNFCLQTSKKVRQVFDYKRRQGEFIGAFAPYGYEKDPQQRNRLIIDEDAAAVVRSIFEWFTQGMSKNGIARKLNAFGLPNPAGYKRGKGLKYCHPNADASALWSAATVARILQNRMYTGTMVQGCYRIKSYKVHTQIRTHPSEWFVVEGTHAPIVSEERFLAAQDLCARDTRAAPSRSEAYLFSGFLRCADCRKAMHRRKTGRYVYYICRTYKERSKTACTKHSIRHEALEQAVLHALRQCIDLAVCVAETAAEIDGASAAQGIPMRLDAAIEAKAREQKKLERYQRRLYEDFCDGLLTRAEYDVMRRDYRASAETVQAAIGALREERRIAARQAGEGNPAWTDFMRSGNFETLSRAVLAAFVERVYIREGGGVSICFRFADPFR